MKSLDPDKLFVEFRDDVTKTNPIKNRKYTLTHSDITGELFLTIGLNYAYDKIEPIRDEVLAEWKLVNDKYILFVQVNLDGEINKASYDKTIKRNEIFIRELSLALEAIRYGDDWFFKTYPNLDNAPIYIHFASLYPNINRVEYWKTPSNFIVNSK